ncbi:bifunctional adenosylcobinamide kinase/adenosylcobinamide-phosphate guanylyltransferase [Jeotgalibacillus marinus]|uniref:Adenosylcobinamide kinase n=1 Tax=Jeotgalibacillus marinus TaxID=86667 RepID=A0ABV3Q0L5_9BACL
MDSGGIITVIGGVRSGKTSWTEKQAILLADAENSRLIYIASGVALDEEMKNRINRHKVDRMNQQWITIEQPVDLMSCTHKLQPSDVVVWDCLTTWLTNELMQRFDETDKKSQLSVQETIQKELYTFINWIKANLLTCFIVSNEVVSEAVFEEELTAVYQKMIGELHQSLVAMSKKAIEMEAGIPLVRKGAYPV